MIVNQVDAHGDLVPDSVCVADIFQIESVHIRAERLSKESSTTKIMTIMPIETSEEVIFIGNNQAESNLMNASESEA